MTPSNHIEVPIRVRYRECDPMNVAHHAAYPVWLEIARTELLRRSGRSYAEMEKRGIYIVVARLNIRYRRPAHYDDELIIACTTKPCAGVKIEHEYQVRRGDELLASAATTVVCVDDQGKLQPVPPDLFA